MSKLTQFLQKAGLVESDDPPFELPSDPAPDPAPAIPDVPVRTPFQAKTTGRADFSVPDSDAPGPPEVSAAGSQDASGYVLAEGISIEAIYQQANIPETSFPIERLQKLIDGLRQLDPTTQKAAVLAMDAADDTWTIEGVLKDAQAKTDALHAYADSVGARATQIQGHIERDIASMNSEKDASIAEIQSQIAELQRKLEATASKHATDISDLSAQRQSAQQAAERERQRVTEYINKINNLVHPFLSSATTR